jgi:hypothetical protein
MKFTGNKSELPEGPEVQESSDVTENVFVKMRKGNDIIWAGNYCC